MRTLSSQELPAVSGGFLCFKIVIKKPTCIKPPKPPKSCKPRPPCSVDPVDPPVDPVDPAPAG